MGGILLSSVFGLATTGQFQAAAPELTMAVPADTARQSKPVFPIKKYKQDTYDELNQKYPLDAPTPSNVKSVVEYDVSSGNYVLRTMVGETEIATPFLMTEEEYRSYSAKKEMLQYWKEKNSKQAKNNEDKFSVTDMKFNIGPADKLFGPGGVQIKTQGSAEILFGYKSSKIDNPGLTERMRKTGNFNFDEKIQLNVTGSIGDKMSVGLNYNTESSFDFDQKMAKLAYKGKEDDIVKSLEAGNVSMPLNSSLIAGSQALFGVKTELQFGRLSVSAIASQQQSQTQTVSSKGGAQTTKFDVSASNYDDNRHFFLSHFFRDKFEQSLSTLPQITSGIQIKNIEVWVTNKRASYDNARNIVALMDLGEVGDNRDNTYWQANGSGANPSNNSNNLYSTLLNNADIRDVQKSNDVLAGLGVPDFNGGVDYEKIESARKLDASEYTLNSSLGFISLRSALNPDEVLAVAFDYSYMGQDYQVGELSSGTVTAPKTLIVKLLKSSAEAPGMKSWDLMMKNVYDLGALDIQKENFKLNVVYRNDSVGTEMQYLTVGEKTSNKLLLRVLKLDQLDTKNEANPDGKFDFISGVTIQPTSGRVIFPVLEPFGEDLGKAIESGYDKKHPNASTVAKNFVFQELYDSTLVVAQENSEKNKFRLVGEYKASSGSEIRLNAMNVPRGSVTVTAGGTTLIENVDYTVDYTMGTVTILNQALIDAGTKIDVRLENQSTFNMQRKTLLGTHMEYKFNKDFSLGGTIMHLSELPLTTKVNYGSEPISNTIWGMNTSWRTESQWLTNALDKLPFVNATKPSTIALNAEVAQLIPGHSSVVSKDGLAYIDDFEATKTSIDIHYPINWVLASTPYSNNNDASKVMFPEAAKTGDIDYGKNRALLSWYYVDPLFNGTTTSNPDYIRNDKNSKSNHLTRAVLEQEIFPNRNIEITKSPRLTVMNLSYYPEERGPYNLDVNPGSYSKGIDPATGKLNDPKTRWGGIMRKLDQTDFESANIEYIEFWMMDPFITDKTNAQKGGDLYFNLGDISEDILKDGKKYFEHGLPVDGDTTKTQTTIWGHVPKTQSTVTAFSGDRKYQDIGLDGLSTEMEKYFGTYRHYMEAVRARISNPTVLAQMEADPFSPLNDPAGDNYHYYRGTDYDKEKLDVLTRYKYFNGTEGNSPDVAQTSEKYSTTATSIPDQEDVNSDNTLNEYEKYYQYRVKINRDNMAVGQNYITDVVTADVKLETGNEAVKWYQFKIPLRSEDREQIGNIRNLKSIRFIRMFLTHFESPITLRLATLDLVRGEWRKYTKNDLNDISKPVVSEGALDVQAVNIEENSSKSPVNYVLPPGVTRETDPGQPALLQLNEQAMVMRVSDLSPGDARAVYKNVLYDMRQYKRLQMFVHAEKMLSDTRTLADNELTCFIRIGSDVKNNYYEYEIPLKITPPGNYSNDDTGDRETVWNPDNKFDFAFSTLTDAKLKRNRDKRSTSSLLPYTIYDPERPLNKITIVGNPTISDVQTIMIGVRNGASTIKSGEIWVNELRMSQFNESGGWAAMGNVAVGLSDLGSVNMAGRMETAGYGSLESNVANRRTDNLYQMNFSTQLELGRFLPEQAKLHIPLYLSYTNETVSPKYNPLDEDILLSDALNNTQSKAEKDSILALSQTVNTSKSFNVTGAKVNIKSKTPQFYDPANVTVSYSYSETNQHSAEIQKNMTTDRRAAVSYNYSFNTQPVEPFKKVKALESPAFKIIKDFNFNYLPSSISFNTNMNRQFTMSQLRNLTASENVVNDTYSREFLWNRQFDIKYDLTRALKFSFQTAMNANITEDPELVPELNKGDYEIWKDKVWREIKKLGSPYTYQQTFSAQWTLPINKLPVFDWVNANVSYNSDYRWNKVASNAGIDAGNNATTMGAWQGDAQLNFESFYNKWKYLKDVNKRLGSQQGSPAKQKFQSRTYVQKIKLEKNKPMTITHRLGSDKLSFAAVDKTGRTIPVSYKVKNASSIELLPVSNTDTITLTLVSQDPNVQSAAKNTIDFMARTLMMVRRASVSYRTTNSMNVTGFKSEPGFLGQGDMDGIKAPGYLFTFGQFDDNTLDEFKEKKWLVTDNTLVNYALLSKTSDLDIRVNLEPFAGFKIELNAKRYDAKSTRVEYFGMNETFSGSFNITAMAIGTAFSPIGNADNNYYSKLFDKMLSNRQIIANRLNARLVNERYPNAGFMAKESFKDKTYDPTRGSYSLNSSDVLIPAFLSAYTGGDASSVNTNPFLDILRMLPNWRVTYDGLSKIGFFKDNFQSITLTHAYTCRYSIGNYSSYSNWVALGDNSQVGFMADTQDGEKAIPTSPYNITDVSLSEQFAPLLGVNVAMKNSMTAKAEYRKQRNLVLNMSSTQLVESTADEYVIGLGYLLKDFDVILKLKSDQQQKIKNDLKLSADLSLKDVKSLLRKVEENITQASSGSKVLSFKFMADYVFSSKLNIQLFYDRQSSTPLISSSYPVSSSNFGVSFKFMLTR